MTDRNGCFDAGDLEELLDADPADPRQIHLRDCPRCRARMLVYREFLEDRHAPPGADPGDAAGRLSEAFRRETGEGGRNAPREKPGRQTRWARWLERPARLWPAWMAAASAVAVFLVLHGWNFRTPEPDRLRGTAREGAFAVISAGPDTRGEMLVRWRSVPGATAYRVLLLDPAMRERAGFGPVRDTTWTLPRADLPSVAPGETVALQVIALAGDREIGATPPRPVRLR